MCVMSRHRDTRGWLSSCYLGGDSFYLAHAHTHISNSWGASRLPRHVTVKHMGSVAVPCHVTMTHTGGAAITCHLGGDSHYLVHGDTHISTCNF
jgi:hypothetical protein